MTRLLSFGAVALVALALVAGPASAGKPSGGGSSGSSAWVTASPNPAAAGGTRVDLTGCGYSFELAQVVITHSAGYTESFYVPMWSTGCMDGAYFLTSEAGTYTINVYQLSSTKKNATNVLKASTTLSVY